jgi:hypothetical protein
VPVTPPDSETQDFWAWLFDAGPWIALFLVWITLVAIGVERFVALRKRIERRVRSVGARPGRRLPP